MRTYDSVMTPSDDGHWVLKSEADKVIKKLKEIDSKNRSAYYKDLAMIAKDVEHHKYKRCLAKKDECKIRSARYQDLWEKWRKTEYDTSGSYYRDYIKWWHRAMKWKHLAEKFKPTPNSTAQQGKGKKNMCEENKNNFKKNPENLFEMLNSLRKKHEETPSEKIMKLALERDKVYDRCKSLSAEIKEAKENNQDYNFLTIQFNHMDDYKKVLGDQIKKLIDET